MLPETDCLQQDLKPTAAFTTGKILTDKLAGKNFTRALVPEEELVVRGTAISLLNPTYEISQAAGMP